MTASRGQRAVAIGLAAIVVYVGAYLIYRTLHVETWPQDGHRYVIVPAGHAVVYYFFRPAMYLDGLATGMRFHIGPHQT